MRRSNKLHLIYTNDFHSHFDVWPKVAGTIKRLKEMCESKQEPFLLLDIGDHMDRSHYLTEGTVGQVNVALLNELGYDYVTIGNNEGITFSKDQLSTLYENRNFEVILNNLGEANGQSPPWLQHYAKQVINGWRIGIIASTAPFSLFYHLLGWQLQDPGATIKQQLAELREEVDFLILLSHLGLPRDEQLAQEVEGIDLIIGAHTHHVLPVGEVVQDTHITQAGKFGQYVGHVTIELSAPSAPNLDAPKTGFKISSNCVSTEHEPEDQQALRTLEAWKGVAKEHLAKQVTVLEQELRIEWHQESELGNLLAESLRRWCQTELSIVNSGQILGSLKKGTVTLEHLLQICPHPINPCTVEISGQEIWSMLQYSLNYDVEHLHIKGFGFRGKILGQLAVDGLHIEYKLDEQKQKKIINILVNEQPIRKNKSYKVATIDMFTFGPIFPEIRNAKNIEYLLPEFIRDILAVRLAQGGLTSAYINRWMKRDS